MLLLQQESREGRKRVAQLEKDTKELQRSEAAARAAAAESEMLHTDALRVAEQLEAHVTADQRTVTALQVSSASMAPSASPSRAPSASPSKRTKIRRAIIPLPPISTSAK